MRTVLITSGGTREYIDDVRIITNISSGRLGSIMAHDFYHSDWNVIHVATKYSCLPELESDRYTLIEVNTALEAEQAIKDNAGRSDAIIHAMAVSDFGCKTDKPLKLKSNDLDGFINHLRDNMFVNPKILPQIKTWNPDVFLVSFKFEVNKTHGELMLSAVYSRDKSGSDIVVANDKAEMVKNKSHIAYFVEKGIRVTKCLNKYDISARLLEILNKRF